MGAGISFCDTPAFCLKRLHCIPAVLDLFRLLEDFSVQSSSQTGQLVTMNQADAVEVGDLVASQKNAHLTHLPIEKDVGGRESSIEEIPASKEYHSGDEDETLHKLEPTAEEMNTLRRVAGPMNWVTFSVAFVELCERFSYYGTTAVCTRLCSRICRWVSLT